MTETEFLRLIDTTLSHIESVFETAGQSGDIDVECARSGSVLEIEFLHNKSKIIVNSQIGNFELWVAAKSGGYHYKFNGHRWLNTRDQSDLMSALAEIALAQGGLRI